MSLQLRAVVISIGAVDLCVGLYIHRDANHASTLR